LPDITLRQPHRPWYARIWHRWFAPGVSYDVRLGKVERAPVVASIKLGGRTVLSIDELGNTDVDADRWKPLKRLLKGSAIHKFHVPGGQIGFTGTQVALANDNVGIAYDWKTNRFTFAIGKMMGLGRYSVVANDDGTVTIAYHYKLGVKGLEVVITAALVFRPSFTNRDIVRIIVARFMASQAAGHNPPIIELYRAFGIL
jgi:hypothetical protein